jgi:hypothetical protein
MSSFHVINFDMIFLMQKAMAHHTTRCEVRTFKDSPPIFLICEVVILMYYMPQ